MHQNEKKEDQAMHAVSIYMIFPPLTFFFFTYNKRTQEAIMPPLSLSRL